MADDAELQARIAAIKGNIDEFKQQQHLQQPYPPSPRFPHGHRGRWQPYARGGRAAYGRQHNNRVLVLANQQSPPAANGVAPNDGPIIPGGQNAAFVKARRPGANQLINKAAFQREQKQKQEDKENARAAKRLKINNEDRNTLNQHIEASSMSGKRELVVDGVRFALREDGSKLMRITDPNTNAKQTPRKVEIANVDFFRTKNGNLVRANAIRDLLRYRVAERYTLRDQSSDQLVSRKEKPQCEHFTKHGTCPFGPTCRFTHDPTKVAVCLTYLKKKSCPKGDSCDLSHDLTYHRVQACQYFLRGNCNNDACPYPHINVNPSAPVCRAFALLGFCKKGEDCTDRHVSECPDYANNAKCEKTKCPLPHIDHASILRKAAEKQAKVGSEDESDVSSDEERDHDHGTGFDDIDSDDAEDVIMGDSANERELSQQHDFISF